MPQNLTWTLVYAPQAGFNRLTAATRLATTWHNYDLAGFLGRFARDWTVGGEFAGQWRCAGLRGEATYTWRFNLRWETKGSILGAAGRPKWKFQIGARLIADLNEYAPHIYESTARSHDPGIAPENRTSVPGVPRTD